jgi:hypothetical protein
MHLARARANTSSRRVLTGTSLAWIPDSTAALNSAYSLADKGSRVSIIGNPGRIRTSHTIIPPGDTKHRGEPDVPLFHENVADGGLFRRSAAEPQEAAEREPGRRMSKS